MPPDPARVLMPSALHIIFAGLTLNCFRRACYFQWVILSIILRILRTQKDVSFLSRKGCTFRIYRNIYFKDCWHEVRSSLKFTPPPPPPKKLRTRLVETRRICFFPLKFCAGMMPFGLGVAVSNLSPKGCDSLVRAVFLRNASLLLSGVRHAGSCFDQKRQERINFFNT